MALSPNYSWAEPDNSSLVKNGASDIRTLGDAIDTSVWNVGFGQAAKNKIINGDFGINQRAFTSSTTDLQFLFDRWRHTFLGGSLTSTAQTFATGNAITGYEPTNYLQSVTASQTTSTYAAILYAGIEDVRTFAGQTATISFFAKTTSGTPSIGIEIQQNFGSGGSAAVTTTVGAKTLSTSWARYTATIAVPSISGKTIGTSSNFGLNLWVSAGATSGVAARASNIGAQNATFQIWGVQIEYGSKATPFQTASGGSPQAELAMCQRYYWRFTGPGLYSSYGAGYFYSTTKGYLDIPNPVPLRAYPASVDFANLAVQDSALSIIAVTALLLDQASLKQSTFEFTIASGGTQHRPLRLINNNNVAGYLGLSAEL